MPDRPILDRLRDRRPILAGVADFFANYARKATVGGGVGAAVTATLLANVGISDEISDGVVGWLAALPWYLQLPVLFVGWFALVYFPANREEAEPDRG